MLERIQALMKERGIKEIDLVRDAKLSNGVFTQWKSGKTKPSLDAIIKIANYFGVTTDYLLLGAPRTNLPMNERPNKHLLEILSNAVNEKREYSEIVHTRESLQKPEYRKVLNFLYDLTRPLIGQQDSTNQPEQNIKHIDHDEQNETIKKAVQSN